MLPVIPSTTPLREFKDHEEGVTAVAVFPDRRRMVTGSLDNTLRLWDLETGVVLKKMEGHSSRVHALAVSRDGQMMASGDENGEVIAWHGGTGEPLTQPIKAHPKRIQSMDFSPDGTVLATGGSYDYTMKLWCTKTWELQVDPIECDDVNCIRYSPSGELLAIAAVCCIDICNADTGECVENLLLEGDTDGDSSRSFSLAWTPDGTRILSGTGGGDEDPAIWEWDTSTWQQVGDLWTGHTGRINAIAINPAGTLVASASDDNHVRLWRLSDRRTIAIFQHSSSLSCVTFSMDGNYILSGGDDKMISEWAVPKIIAMNAKARNGCITGDLLSTQELLTQEIHTDANSSSYANRSFIMAREHDWDHALDDAIKSISIQPSLTGYISKGIALCGKGQVQDARRAFDLASMFTNENSETIHFLLLIKTIALFNAHQHEEAILLVQELAAACPNADTLACHVVEAYLRVQLGINASAAAHHDEAADHFTAAVNSTAFSSKSPIHLIYNDLVVLFGWDLQSLELTAHQKRCQAFLSAGKPEEALESHRYMMDTIDETTKASCLDWSNAFKQECSALAVLGLEIPGQDQDGYNTEPDFFGGMHDRPQTSGPRPQKHLGRLKRLKLAVTRTPRPAPAPAPPTQSSATAPPTFQARIRHLLTSRPENAAPHVVDVPYAQGRERNAAAGAPGNDEDLVPIEYFDVDPPQNPDSQQQSTAVQINAGEHGGGRLCCCC